MELDLQVGPEEIMSREVELGWASGISLLRVVQVVRQQHATDIVLVTLSSTAV